MIPEHVLKTRKIPEHGLETGKFPEQVPETGKIPQNVPETGKIPEHVPETVKISEQTRSGNRKTFRNMLQKLTRSRNRKISVTHLETDKKFTNYS